MFVVAATNHAIAISFQSTYVMKSEAQQAMDKCWKNGYFEFTQGTVLINIPATTPDGISVASVFTPQGASGEFVGQVVFSTRGGRHPVYIFAPVVQNHPLAGTVYGDSIQDASDIWYDILYAHSQYN